MRKDIHPKYEEIITSYSCGNVMKIRSTAGHDLNLDVCSKCHLLFTGEQRNVATGDHADRFNKRFNIPGSEQDRISEESIIRRFFCTCNLPFINSEKFRGANSLSFPAAGRCQVSGSHSFQKDFMMSGKPTARQGGMARCGGSIVQGSAGVRIDVPTDAACSMCPDGVMSGHPVNPLLGAKAFPGEADIVLSGPLPFILSHTYSSYRIKMPAPVGSLGPGWKMPADIHLRLRNNTLILSDNGGRNLYSKHLSPSEDGYSHSESLWLVHGDVAKLDGGHRLAALQQALPGELRLGPYHYLATNSPQGPWQLLSWCERVPEADGMPPAPLPPYRVLTGLMDHFEHTQTLHRETADEFSGEITGVTDGIGRHFRLVLATQTQRAEEAR